MGYKPTLSLEDIYTFMCEHKAEKMETSELAEKFVKFNEKYIDPLAKENYKEYVTMYSLCCDVVFGYRETAFMAGFKAACSLFVDIRIEGGAANA